LKNHDFNAQTNAPFSNLIFAFINSKIAFKVHANLLRNLYRTHASRKKTLINWHVSHYSFIAKLLLVIKQKKGEAFSHPPSFYV
jgi:hypothetical protein